MKKMTSKECQIELLREILREVQAMNEQQRAFLALLVRKPSPNAKAQAEVPKWRS